MLGEAEEVRLQPVHQGQLQPHTLGAHPTGQPTGHPHQSRQRDTAHLSARLSPSSRLKVSGSRQRHFYFGYESLSQAAPDVGPLCIYRG